MKRTSLTWLYFAFQILFMFVAPCMFVWLQAGSLTTGYKVSVTAILVTIIIYIMFRKLFLDKWLKTFDMKIINIETNALSITDKASIEKSKKVWRSYSLVQAILNAIVPLLVFVLAIITIKVVEQGLIKLFGCLMFCLISVFIGVIFRIAEIYSIKFPHE